MRIRVAREAARAIRAQSQCPAPTRQASRCLSSTARHAAVPIPVTALGPPPEPPQPSSSGYGERIDKRRKQQRMLEQAKELRAAQSPQKGKSSSPLQKRFWNEVQVIEVPEGYQIMLDKRPVRTPTKKIITIAYSKPHLAHAIAIEWDLLDTAQQALKNHKIPMTSIVSRAEDVAEEDANGQIKIRQEITTAMMRYLDTDTLLCWAEESSSQGTMDLERPEAGSGRQSLRSIQIITAKPIIGYLTTTVWPGVEIRPVLNEGSIMPLKQSDFTRSVVSGWIMGLSPYELAALERAALATKSLLVATRLIIEWSEEFRDLQRDLSGPRFGIEQAAEAASLEVRWQTGIWGEVEDTHDVNKEDVRLQLGSAVLLVSGLR
jgi:ATP synthase mitochondrial F1 complex assembly factor 2